MKAIKAMKGVSVKEAILMQNKMILRIGISLSIIAWLLPAVGIIVESPQGEITELLTWFFVWPVFYFLMLSFSAVISLYMIPEFINRLFGDRIATFFRGFIQAFILIGMPASSISRICQTMILVPLKVGVPPQILLSATMYLLISILMMKV